jgi:tRNA1Val (adenine37-N6)-methyltransferase
MKTLKREYLVNNITLYQPQNGYCYNSDTHFLFNFIKQNLKQFKNIKGELLDIGSGSGILGLLVARDYENINLNQAEIQKEFQFLSQKNAEVNNIKNQLFKGSFLDLKFEKQFDYIVSNPPFYPSSVVQSGNECLKIARYNDNLPLEQFIFKASKLLTSKGQFFFCYDVKLLAEIITHCSTSKLNIESVQFLHPKQSKEATLVMIHTRKSSKSLMKILPPAVMFDEDGEFMDSTNAIYELCSTHSIKCEVTI